MEPFDRDSLESILRRTGAYDEDEFSRIDLFDKPSWIYPRSRILFELGWLGTSGYWVYEARGARIGLEIHKGLVRSACAYGSEPHQVANAAELEDAIIAQKYAKREPLVTDA